MLIGTAYQLKFLQLHQQLFSDFARKMVDDLQRDVSFVLRELSGVMGEFLVLSNHRFSLTDVCDLIVYLHTC